MCEAEIDRYFRIKIKSNRNQIWTYKIIKDHKPEIKSKEELPLDKSLITNSVKEVKFENESGIGPWRAVP
jgi:hypothetical protein